MPKKDELSKSVKNSSAQASLFADETAIVLTKGSNELTIQKYFEGVLKLSESVYEYPVDLDDVWALAYAEKCVAVRTLKKNFIEDVDYISFDKKVKREKGGTIARVYMLSTSCLEYFIARKVRPVFEVYRKVFHKVAGKKEKMYPESEVKKHLLDADRQVREACEASLRLQMEIHDLRAKANAYRHILDEESERILKMLIFIERNKLTEKLKAYLAV